MSELDVFTKQKILVIGDLMIDKYVIGTVERISPEAPVPVLRQTKVKRKLGGTGNVIMNLCSLGACVRAIGRLGNDDEALFLKEKVVSYGVDDKYVFKEGKTIVKTRVSANNQQLIRIDDEEIIPPSQYVINAIKDNLNKIMEGISATIISDYGKGFITEELSNIIIKAAHEYHIPVLVDPKGKSAAKYHGAFAITPNTKEFIDMTGTSFPLSEQSIVEHGVRLCEENALDYVFYTRSERGISIIDRQNKVKKDLPAVAKEVIDVTGAGDTVISVAALAIAAGFSVEKSIILANFAASVVVSKFGTAQCSLAELENKWKRFLSENPTTGNDVFLAC